MARYLIVAHLTAGSPELRRHVATVRKTDPTAEFTLLLPATPASYWRAWDELEAHANAERRADAACLMSIPPISSCSALIARSSSGSGILRGAGACATCSRY